MGNQESISSDTYIIKKKKPVQNNKQQSSYQEPLQNNKQQSSYQEPLQNNKQHTWQEPRQTQKTHQTRQDHRESRQSLQYSQQTYQDRPQQNNELYDKKNSNNALMERNMLSDIYSKKNQLISYPSSSNDEMTIPKKNIDNIKFTPYNFDEEVNSFKQNIDTERVEFENKEKERRKMFERSEKDKQKYLEIQIKKFEAEYNPWEILGLEQNDYNINNIKKAYKKNALKYHPDRAGTKYQDKFQLITQSYIYLLKKSEDNNMLETKINKKVEKSNYEDDINEGVENIYINKDNFDINQFNKIFGQYKMPSSFDKGYSDMMKEDINEQREEPLFNKKFSNDIFNANFDNVKTKKNSTAIIQFQEPDALDSSVNNLSQSFLGVDDIQDFGSVNNNNLSYTDYKKAHVNENLLIDVNKVKYKTYNSVDQLESDRSNISHTMSPEDKRRYEYLERKKTEDDDLRMRQQKNYDEMVGQQYSKINQRLIIHK